MQAHRGRLQAQGGGVEESEPWAQGDPFEASAARTLLGKLENKLVPRERELRGPAFEQARDYIARAEQLGGVDAFFKKSYPQPPRPDQRRVDIDVLCGRAFVPAPPEAE